MRRLLVDLNVVLDVLLDRRPHVESSAAIWARVEKGAAEGFLPAHGFTTVHFLAAQAHDRAFARRAVNDLLQVFRVAPVDEAVLRAATLSPLADFEDAVCAASGVAVGCELIVTRNTADFRGAPLPALDPVAALALLDSDQTLSG